MGRTPLVLVLAAAFAGFGCGEEAPEPSAGPAPTSASGSAERAAVPADRERPRTAPRASQRASRVEVLAANLTVPWDIAFLPDGRALVTERPGRIRIMSARGRLQAGVAARVPTRARGEGGLLGLAIDPDFADGRRFAYVYVTTAAGMQVQRYRMTGDRLRRDGVVLDGIAAGPIHDSGRLRFGPDERLYVATGDAGRRELAQNRRSLNGKILRLDPAQYRRRTDSPTVYSTGHRNPQGLDWQPASDRLFATEHGPSGFDGAGGDDEVNVVSRGANYGWPRVRGTRHGRFAAPVKVWRRAIAPSGATFVTRPGSSWTGDLLVAALKGRSLRRLSVSGGRVVGEQTLLAARYGRLRAVEEAPDGSVWVTTSNRDNYGRPVTRSDDRILRLTPPRR